MTSSEQQFTANSFFELLNQVIEDLGRDKIPSHSPQNSIITIQENDRVLQVLAGPGSGKTEMLVWRVLYDLLVCDTPSESVMITTFTRRAATELNVRIVERCDQLLSKALNNGLTVNDPKVHNLRIGTIHSLCDRLLSEFDDQYMASGTQLIDQAECAARLARCHRFDLGYDGNNRLIDRLLGYRELVALFKPAWERATWPGKLIERIDFLSGLLNQQIETWYPRCSPGNINNGIQILKNIPDLTNELVELCERWEQYLDKNQILDFATIQKRFLEVQSKVQDKLLHIFVDEFQDNNPIQFALHTGWLKNPNIRLTVVGDDDQALYRFRGSDLACFSELEPFCRNRSISYRQEKLEANYRSTRAIVDFSRAFRNQSVLCQTSMAKNVGSPDNANPGIPVRLLRGPWDAVCRCVANELLDHGCGQPLEQNGKLPETGAVLMFSTSERSQTSASLSMRSALEEESIRVYNPRNKTAADKGSPVYELMALISYLIDPVTKAPVGRGGREVEVAASMNDRNKAAAAITDLPRKERGNPFRISEDHLKYQKGFIKVDGRNSIGNPGPTTRDLLEYIDTIRENLAQATENYQSGLSEHKPRLTLAGLIARLLSFRRYRNSGFTENLFRQALFTNLLEAHTAPTRRTMAPLDTPLEVRRNDSGKYVWSDHYWNFLNIFGSYLHNSRIDDLEVKEFEEDAVLLLTFHQAKGLEFDHVYVAGTGRAVDLSPVLRTKLFSSETPDYEVDRETGTLTSTDQDINKLALADREREVYVAITRAKKTLTLLHDPEHDREFLNLNPTIESLFKSRSPQKHPQFPDVEILEYTP